MAEPKRFAMVCAANMNRSMEGGGGGSWEGRSYEGGFVHTKRATCALHVYAILYKTADYKELEKKIAQDTSAPPCLRHLVHASDHIK
jgi:hypothetical protein